VAELKWEEDNPQVDDVRALFDSRCLRVWHLEGREKTLTIERTARLTSGSKDGSEKKQALVYFQGVPLPLVLNATNRDTIIQLYGKARSGWVGKRLTLYPDQTKAFGKMQDCIRIRNEVPKPATEGKR
jgi:hypothetical protein